MEPQSQEPLPPPPKKHKAEQTGAAGSKPQPSAPALQPKTAASNFDISAESRAMLDASRKLLEELATANDVVEGLDDDAGEDAVDLALLPMPYTRMEPAHPVFASAHGSAPDEGAGPGPSSLASAATAATAGPAGVEVDAAGPMVIITCQFKGGSEKLRLRTTDKVRKLLQGFSLFMEKKGITVPSNASVQFDGEKCDLDDTIADAGIEDCDSVDVVWK